MKKYILFSLIIGFVNIIQAQTTKINLSTQSSGNLPISRIIGPSSSTSPVCPNGANNSLTTVGCVSSSGNSYFIGESTVTVSGVPSSLYVAVGTSASTAIERQLTQDDILPGFSITGFSGGSSVEIGATISNPAFTSSYSSIPISASITNSDNIDSPLSLTTPFTSGTVVGSFVHTTNSSTTFTLTAISTTTQLSYQHINWLPRSFGGVGSAGATSSVTSSGTTAILSTTDVMTSLGLASTNVGTIYGPYSPSNQKIYLLLIGGTHTFKDATTGFTFVFNSSTAVTFVNQYGSTISMYLYETTNLLSGTYTIMVVN